MFGREGVCRIALGHVGVPKGAGREFRCPTVWDIVVGGDIVCPRFRIPMVGVDIHSAARDILCRLPQMWEVWYFPPRPPRRVSWHPGAKDRCAAGSVVLRWAQVRLLWAIRTILTDWERRRRPVRQFVYVAHMMLY